MYTHGKLQELKNITGLTSAAAAAKLQLDGYNELPAARRDGILRLIVGIFSEPIFLLLLIGIVAYFLIGSTEEACILSVFVLMVVSITCYQEHKSKHALQALRNLSSPRAFVIRDSFGRRIAAREVVVDDILVISEGDCIPADAVLLSADNLQIDESIITGESLPALKSSEQQCFLGTYVIQGKGIAKVIATGAATVVGKIGKKLATLKSERTQLQIETGVLVRDLALWGIFICIVAVLIYGISRNDWVNALLVGIGLAMAIMPEELPVVLTVFLAIGAWRLSRSQVLTRRIPAVETLGAATVLCVDKTGTITQNKMAVAKFYAQGQFYAASDVHYDGSFPEQFHQLVEYSILASQRDPFDPMEVAIKNFGEQYLSNTEHLHRDWQLVQQYPLSKELFAISLVWRSLAKNEYVVAAKGAPEAIFDLCHLPQDTVDILMSSIHELADQGLRIIGVAKASFEQTALPSIQHDFNFQFIGLVGLADPVRPSVAHALTKCYDAGIRVVMITGDYQGTALKVAQEIGLRNTAKVISGSQMTRMSDLELASAIQGVNIFARILPEQKLRIVEALKNHGEVVAMTGDGVNDATALHAANIGIAMGERGTDVAREAADLVLLNDDFSSIVTAVALGRRVFDNIKKAIAYLFAVHIPIIGMTLIPVIMQWPVILLPIHIVFLELVIDPTCSIVFEAEKAEDDIMRRSPRAKNESLLTSKMNFIGVLQGIGALLLSLLTLLAAKHFALPETQIRALVFVSLVINNLMLIFANLSWQSSLGQVIKDKNVALWWVVTGALAILAIVLFVPFLRHLFYIDVWNLRGWAICSTMLVGSLVWLFIMRKLVINKIVI
jgi:P-type Ca2+ transporter type 2C